MENIDDESYCKSSTQITYWLLNDEVMQTLIDFDFEIYFDIISFIFVFFSEMDLNLLMIVIVLLMKLFFK